MVPLLDRLDLHVEVPAAGGSAETAALAAAARRGQLRRFQDVPGTYVNGQMGLSAVRTYCEADATAIALLRTAMSKLSLSARSFHRVLKIARTVADLDESERIGSAHVAEAIQYRGLDRGTFRSGIGSA